MALLEVSDLEIAVAVGGNLLPVVRGVSFSVEEYETLGIVGESGCGKSLTSLAIMGLLEGSQVRITGGSIRFAGRELTTLDARERRSGSGAHAHGCHQSAPGGAALAGFAEFAGSRSCRWS